MPIRRLLLPLFIAALPALAQETVNVHVVEVPVTVVARGGDAVRGLTAANFALFDDGKPQTITAFDTIDFSSPAQPATALSPLNPNARRSFLLLFDLGYSDVKSMERARIAARDFLAANVGPRDLVAVGNIDPEQSFRLLTFFTTDRTVVASAIAHPQEFHGNDPLQISDTDAFASGSGLAATNEETATSASGRASAADDARAEIRDLTARANRDFMTRRVMREIDSLGLLASTLRAVPGRKQVVLLSGGFDPSLVRGRTGRGSSGQDAADLAKATSGQGYLIDNDARFGNTASQNTLDAMVKLFKQSDVVLHAIDISGIRVDGSGSPRASSISNDGLHLLADPTGGTVFENANNLRTDFDRMMREQEVVYVLAFQAKAVKPGKLHTLSVKTVNVPGATVHYRLAYAEPGGDAPIERVLTNAEIVVNDIPQDAIHVAALAAAPPARGRAAVPLFLEVDGKDLLAGATKPVPVDVFIYAFDEKGTVHDRVYQHLAVDPAKASAAVREQGIKYFATLALDPGRYVVKALVVAADTQKRGFTRADVVVPGATDMTVLPPLFLDAPGKWSLLKGAQHSESAYPFQLDGEPFIPSAAPHLRPAQPREFALFLYNADPEQMLMQATVTDAAGVTRPAAPSLVRQLRGEGVTKLVFQYDPANVAPGRGKLDLLLHKKGSTEMRHSVVPIVVGAQ
jgi:VWFA-related protein